jgi:hypothetical protein
MKYCSRVRCYRLQVKSENVGQPMKKVKKQWIIDSCLISSEQNFIPAIFTTTTKKNPYIKEGQTIQWPSEKLHTDKDEFEDTIGIIRILKSKDRQYNGIKEKDKEEFEDTIGIIRIRKSKKDLQDNDKKKKEKRTNKCLKIPKG